MTSAPVAATPTPTAEAEAEAPQYVTPPWSQPRGFLGCAGCLAILAYCLIAWGLVMVGLAVLLRRLGG